MSRGREPNRRSNASRGGQRKRKKRRPKKSGTPKIIAMVVGLVVVIGVCAGFFKIAMDGWQRGMDAEARRRGLDPKILNAPIEMSRRDEVWNVDPAWSDKLASEIALGSCRYRHPLEFQAETVPNPPMNIHAVFYYREADPVGKRDSIVFKVNQAPEYSTDDAGMEKLAKFLVAADAGSMRRTSEPIYERGTLNGRRCIRASFEGYDPATQRDVVNIYYSITHNGITANVQMNLTVPVAPERMQLLENAAHSVRFE